jgi:hypothetical protein
VRRFALQHFELVGIVDEQPHTATEHVDCGLEAGCQHEPRGGTKFLIIEMLPVDEIRCLRIPELPEHVEASDGSAQETYE